MRKIRSTLGGSNRGHKGLITGLIIVAGVIVLGFAGFCAYWEFAPTRLYGIDVSHYQGDISWRALKESGAKFAYVKATEGKSFTDPDFKTNWNDALSHKIPVGAYHYYSASSSGTEQAAYYIAQVPRVKGVLPPAIDIETSGTNLPDFKKQLAVFVQAIKVHYGVKPVFYVPPRVYNLLYDDYVGYDFWIIDYKSVKSPDVRGWTFWQYTDKGSRAGVNGHVDLDVFQGSRWSFRSMLAH